MTMVTHSEASLVQAEGVPGVQALKDVGLDYLAKIPAEVAFWVLLGTVLVGSVVGVVVTVKTLKSVKRTIKTHMARMSAAIKEQATADKDRLNILDRMDQLKSQNWRGWYAKAHLGLCLLVSGVGIALAAEQHASMVFPSNLLAFVAFEGLAVAVMLRIEDRAKRALPYRGLIVLYWVAIGVAAGVQTTHIANPVGQVIWAAFTVSGGLVYHLHMSSVRADKEERLRESEKRWLKRKMELVRWLRPLEAIQVVWEKAADADLSTDEATRRVRERAETRREDRLLDQVMWSVWRLRRAQQARKVWGFSWFREWREHNHLVLTQVAIGRAGLHVAPERLESLLRRLEAMDLAPKLAGMRSRSDARLIWGTYAGGAGGGSAAGSVGSIRQFALPSAESKVEPAASGSGREVQVVFVAEPSRSGAGFDSAQGSGAGFDHQGSGAGVESVSSGAGFDSAGSKSGGAGAEFGSGPVEIGEFEVQGSGSADLGDEGTQAGEAGLWSHASDGWIPPTTDEAWSREDEWPTLFDDAPTPQRRTLPLVVQPPAATSDDNVRRVRTMGELRQELRRAWEAREITAVSSEQIYKTLSISKKRAAELREWLLREELQLALKAGRLTEVNAVVKEFGITRKQAEHLLSWGVEQGLVCVADAEQRPAQ